MFLLDLFNIILYFIYHLPNLFNLTEKLFHEAINVDGHIVHARIFVITLGLQWIMMKRISQSGDESELKLDRKVPRANDKRTFMAPCEIENVFYVQNPLFMTVKLLSINLLERNGNRAKIILPSDELT